MSASKKLTTGGIIAAEGPVNAMAITYFYKFRETFILYSEVRHILPVIIPNQIIDGSYE